jgi:general stress protein 26
MTVDITESSEHIAHFLSNHKVGVLATVDSTGKPHAATVYFTYDREFNIYFVTKKDTQKSRNLQASGRAAVAIYDTGSQTTVQAEGAVSEVTNKQLAEGIITEIWSIALETSKSHIPPTSKMTAGGYVVYRISAPSLRMAAFSRSDPADYDKIFETVNTGPSLT